MSDLSEIEQNIVAYWLDEQAAHFTMADRFYPYGELTLIWEDKIGVATRKFGPKVRKDAKSVATALIDRLIAAGVYSTKTNDFGGTMHNFKPDLFRAEVETAKASDPLIAKARAGGGGYWEALFAELTAEKAG